MPRWGWRLRPFILVLLIVFNTFSLIVIATATYVAVSNIMTEQISQTRLDFLDTNQKQLMDRINSIEETAISISTDFNIRRIADSDPRDDYDFIVAKQELDSILHSYSYIKGYIASIQVYTDFFKGSPGVVDRIFHLAEIPWKEQLPHLEKEESIWIPEREDIHSLMGKRSVITNVRKIRNTQGEIFGYVEVNMDLASLRELLINSNKPHNERVLVILDPQNRPITEIIQSRDDRDVRNREWLFPDAVTPEKGYHIENVQGERFVYSQTAERPFEWRLVDILPYNEVYESVEKIRNVVILSGMLMLLLTIPLSLYLSGKIIRPVSRLVIGFQRVKAGDFHFRLDGHFIFEFNMLSIAFNHMTDRIRELLQRVKEEHRLKREAELSALQSQIYPHFLYNTLDMINWNAVKKGDLEISTMVSRLARLFRISLSKGNMFIPLRDELEHARLYLQLQLSRYEREIVLEEKVEPALRKSYVPKIILQPLIENAILHGFTDNMDRQPKINIYAERISPSRFRLAVEDNGVGLDGESLAKRISASDKAQSQPSTASSGYGIRNIRERLHMYFGDEYDVVIRNGDEGGVKVEIELPVIESWDDLQSKFGNMRGETS